MMIRLNSFAPAGAASAVDWPATVFPSPALDSLDAEGLDVSSQPAREHATAAATNKNGQKGPRIDRRMIEFPCLKLSDERRPILRGRTQRAEEG
jgi:hypothetical protein